MGPGARGQASTRGLHGGGTGCALAWTIVACGPAVDTTFEATGTPATTADDGAASAAEAAETISSTPTDSNSSENGAAIVIDPDVGSRLYACDHWGQDCPAGEKCVPYTGDTGSPWGSTRCFPVADDPKAPGDACTVVGNAMRGIDDCERGAMCWGVDPDTNTGTCVELCHGNEGNPVCSNPCDGCAITSEGILNLCLPSCDPLAQDCPGDQACYPVDDRFVCAPDASGEQGLAGDPCAFLNVCDPGTACLAAEMVPGCAGATGCCAPFCDASVADGCDSLLPGTSCVPLFEPGQGPDACLGIGVVGACVIAN
jgi:hypothetical protein